jgi:hypothetical protein
MPLLESVLLKMRWSHPFRDFLNELFQSDSSRSATIAPVPLGLIQRLIGAIEHAL